jgi:hypothetical protein
VHHIRCGKRSIRRDVVAGVPDDHQRVVVVEADRVEDGTLDLKDIDILRVGKRGRRQEL